jgi:hypothetical protein
VVPLQKATFTLMPTLNGRTLERRHGYHSAMNLWKPTAFNQARYPAAFTTG